MKSISTTSPVFGMRKNLHFFATIAIGVLASFLLTLNLSEATNAASQSVTAANNNSSYTASISFDDTVQIPVVPTAAQATYTAQSPQQISFSNTCPKGATLSISSKSTDLTNTNNNGLKIASTKNTNAALSDNSWGYSLDGTKFSGVKADGGLTELFSTSSAIAQNSPRTLNVYYGVRTDNKLQSGTYSNDVLYTVAVNAECLTYNVKFNVNGGQSTFADKTLNFGDKLDLSKYIPTREGYDFTGWSNGTSTFPASTGSTNINPNNSFTLTLTANYSLHAYTANFDYTGSEQTWTAPYSGYYKVEAWGAQGGKGFWPDTTVGTYGGKGAFVSGLIKEDVNAKYYVYVGGKGSDQPSSVSGSYAQGGYNGGGRGAYDANNYNAPGGGGGGATDISIINGAVNDVTRLRARVLVSAGGGGGGAMENSMLGKTNYAGDGVAGAALQNKNSVHIYSLGVISANITQTKGYQFGIGESGSAGSSIGEGPAGGGGGYYGGTSPKASNGAGGPSFGGTSYLSGYVGAIAVESQNSTAPRKNSSGVTCADGTTDITCSYHYSGKIFTNGVMKSGNDSIIEPNGSTATGHSGNGYARITWLGDKI